MTMPSGALPWTSNWICVGDINRMISQRKRGGGTIAFQNQTLWQALSKTDLILAPPGHTRTEALQLIKSTHVDPDAVPPVKPVAKTPSTAKAKRPKGG